MTTEQKNMELMRTLDDVWTPQKSARSGEFALCQPCSRAGRPVRHES